MSWTDTTVAQILGQSLAEIESMTVGDIAALLRKVFARPVDGARAADSLFRWRASKLLGVDVTSDTNDLVAELLRNGAPHHQAFLASGWIDPFLQPPPPETPNPPPHQEPSAHLGD